MSGPTPTCDKFMFGFWAKILSHVGTDPDISKFYPGGKNPTNIKIWTSGIGFRFLRQIFYHVAGMLPMFWKFYRGGKNPANIKFWISWVWCQFCSKSFIKCRDRSQHVINFYSVSGPKFYHMSGPIPTLSKIYLGVKNPTNINKLKFCNLLSVSAPNLLSHAGKTPDVLNILSRGRKSCQYEILNFLNLLLVLRQFVYQMLGPIPTCDKFIFSFCTKFLSHVGTNPNIFNIWSTGHVLNF